MSELQDAIRAELLDARTCGRPITPADAARRAQHRLNQARILAHMAARSAEGMKRHAEVCAETERFFERLFSKPRKRY